MFLNLSDLRVIDALLLAFLFFCGYRVVRAVQYYILRRRFEAALGQLRQALIEMDEASYENPKDKDDEAA